MTPEPNAPQPAAKKSLPSFKALLVVSLAAMIAGVLLSPQLDTFAWPDNVPVVPDAADDGNRAAPADEAKPSAGAPEPAARASAESDDAEGTSDVSGAWMLTNRIESATNATFKNLALGFELRLKQDGNRVTGTGTKVTENGKALAAGRKTPITVEGTLDGHQLKLKFTERGAQRASSGQLSLELTDDGTLRGSFTSDAANARGSSVAQRAGR